MADLQGPPPPPGKLPDPAVVLEQAKLLPFAAWQPVLAGMLVGLGMRVAFFGDPGGMYSAMMASFIFLSPLVVGATTVYVAERRLRRTWSYYIVSSVSANLLFVCATLLMLIEGLICAIVIVPLFAIVGMIGGLIMGIVCRLTMWPKQTLYSIALLPFLLGGVEGTIETPSRFGTVERTVSIAAAPEVIWQEIMNAGDIQPGEMNRAWIFRIGVPLPLAGVVQQSPEGPVRKITMGKDVHFDQVFTEFEENRYVHWTYRLYEDSFPPYALDDHVLVGGYYFDVRDTSYSLVPIARGTELRIRMGYRVTTQFNWYAEPVAQLLLGNFEEVVLDFYRRRSQDHSIASAEEIP